MRILDAPKSIVERVIQFHRLSGWLLSVRVTDVRALSFSLERNDVGRER